MSWVRGVLTTFVLCAVSTASVVAGSSGASTPDPSTTTSTTTSATPPSTDDAAPADIVAEFGHDGLDVPPDPYTAAIADRLGPDGAIDSQLALDMFASAYGGAGQLGANPLPGDPADGTSAMGAVLAVWEQLTDAQRSAITQLWSAPPPVEEPAGFGGARPRLLGDLVSAASAEIAAHWGSALLRPVEVSTVDLPGVLRADTTPMTATGDFASSVDTYEVCKIRVDPATQADPDGLRQTIFHEVAHCFQKQIHLWSEPMWVIEGQAEWISANLACCAGTINEWWLQWLSQPRDLATRGYDAIGFYGSLERVGVDVWHVVQPMLRAAASGGDFASIYAAATQSVPADFLAQLALNQAARSDVGDPWLPHGSGAPSERFPTRTVSLQSGQTLIESGAISAIDSTSAVVSPPDAVVVVASSIGPFVAGTAGHTVVSAGPGELRLCVAEQCVCPNGATAAGEVLGAGATVAIGIGNATFASVMAELMVTSLPLDEACSLLSPPTLASCATGRWELVAAEYGADVIPGLAAVEVTGGIGGRTLTISSDRAYTMADDGSDPLRASATTGGVAVDVSVTLVGSISGSVEFAEPDQATFTASGGDMVAHVSTAVSGTPPVIIDQPVAELGVLGTGSARVACSADALITTFPNVTFTYRRP